MKRPHPHPRALIITAFVAGLLLIGGVALIERRLWLEADGDLGPIESWSDVPLELLSLGSLAIMMAVTLLAAASWLWRRRSRPQFTVRRLMVAVAIVGLILGPVAVTVQLAGTAYGHRETAIGHARLAATLRHNGSMIAVMARREKTESIRHNHLSAMAEHTSAADYFEALREKYCRAARRPWAPVEPDPPPPK